MNIPGAGRLNTTKEYYFSRKLKEIEQKRRDGEVVINLGIGNPDLPPPDRVVKRLIESSQEPGNHGYQSYVGISELRNAFSKWYQTYYHLDLDPNKEILPLMGSKEGIFYITMAFLNEGDQVLVPDPGYPTYKAVSELVGGEVLTYDLTREQNWLPDLTMLEREDLTRVKIMWINYPHMPTGAKASARIFEELADFGKRNEILLCNDNPYSFILNDNPISLLSAGGPDKLVLELNSLSKSHNMAGWRIGMVAGNAEYINLINKVTSNIQSGMFLPVQHAAVEAMNNPASWYQDLNKIYSKRREWVEDILNLLECRYEQEQAGLFVWAGVPPGYDSFQFSDKILDETGVFITPGGIFGQNGSGYIRISLCSPEKILKEAKGKIEKYIKK